MPRPLSARLGPTPQAGLPPGSRPRPGIRAGEPAPIALTIAPPGRCICARTGPRDGTGKNHRALAPRPERRYLGPVLALFAVLEAKRASAGPTASLDPRRFPLPGAECGLPPHRLPPSPPLGGSSPSDRADAHDARAAFGCRVRQPGCTPLLQGYGPEWGNCRRS